jgi:hypothetical protein
LHTILHAIAKLFCSADCNIPDGVLPGLQVRAAMGLPSVASSGGNRCNPYCVLNYVCPDGRAGAQPGSFRCIRLGATRPCYGALNPRWEDETFVVPLDADASGHSGGGGVTGRGRGRLVLDIFNRKQFVSPHADGSGRSEGERAGAGFGGNTDGLRDEFLGRVRTVRTTHFRCVEHPPFSA